MLLIVPILCSDILITISGASVPSDQSSTGCEQVGLSQSHIGLPGLAWTGLDWVPIFILARTISSY